MYSVPPMPQYFAWVDCRNGFQVEKKVDRTVATWVHRLRKRETIVTKVGGECSAFWLLAVRRRIKSELQLWLLIIISNNQVSEREVSELKVFSNEALENATKDGKFLNNNDLIATSC